MAPARETTTPKSSPSASVDPISSSQPVAHEVPVIASGARPASASGSRELFTEATSTVLVSENGAVIRLSAAVVPGQLLFLIHQDSKREVVAQVLRKRYFRPTNCYVELHFTEPAPGFWGMEFPAAPGSNQSKSEQSEAIAQVQSARPTADAPRKPNPVPSAQEVTELKKEVDVLRDQLKSLLQSKPGAVISSAAAPLSQKGSTSEALSPHAIPQESPTIPSQLSRLPLEPSEIFSDSGLLDTDANPDRTQQSSRLSRARSSRLHAKPESDFFRRIIPVAAGLLVFGTAAAWYTNRLPGLPPPTFFFATSSSASSSTTNSVASAPIGPLTQKTNPRDDSLNTAQFGNVLGATPAAPHETSSLSGPLVTEATPYTPPAYQPDKMPDRDSLSTATKKKSTVVNVVKHDSFPSPDKTSSTPATAEGDSGVVPPKLLTFVQGIAPSEAVRGFVAGNVILDAVLGPDGRVISSTVVSGRSSLRASASEKLKQYRYQPATQNGKPVSAHVTVTIQCWFEP